MRRCVALVCTLIFAALGVFVGYLVPARTPCRSSAPAWRCCPSSAALFIPLDQSRTRCSTSPTGPRCTASAEIARAPLTHELPWYAVVNAVGWFAIFVAGAAWRMSKDTARV